MRRSPDESTYEHKHTETWNILAITDVFLHQKRVNVCEHAVKMGSTACSHTFTLFWLRKTSVIAKIFQISMCLCSSVLLSGDLIFWWVFPFFSYLLILFSVLPFSSLSFIPIVLPGTQVFHQSLHPSMSTANNFTSYQGFLLSGSLFVLSSWCLLKSQLKLPLFSGFTIVPFNGLC